MPSHSHGCPCLAEPANHSAGDHLTLVSVRASLDRDSCHRLALAPGMADGAFRSRCLLGACDAGMARTSAKTPVDARSDPLTSIMSLVSHQRFPTDAHAIRDPLTVSALPRLCDFGRNPRGHVRNGSKAPFWPAAYHFRSTPINGHSQSPVGMPQRCQLRT